MNERERHLESVTTIISSSLYYSVLVTIINSTILWRAMYVTIGGLIEREKGGGVMHKGRDVVF